jgi:hypothetical protein
MSDRATGYLPLTRASAKKLWVVRWVFTALIPFAFVLWGIGIFVSALGKTNPVNSAIFEFLFLIGFGALFGGLVGSILGWRAVGPEARLLERRQGDRESLVELRNVHPVFAAATRQIQEARATQVAPAVPSPFLRGSN